MITDNKKTIEEAALAVGARYFSLALLLMVPLIMAGCTSGLVGGVFVIWQFAHKSILMQIMGGLIVLIGLASPVWVNRAYEKLMEFPARKILKGMMSFERAAAERALKLAGESCYYNAAAAKFGGAIAINPASSRIAVVLGSYQKGGGHNFTDLVLSLSEIVGCSAVKEGAVWREDGARASSMQMLRTMNHNIKEAANQSANTGLLLKTTNIKHPEILINFGFEEAKPWLLVLEKMRKNTLEIPERSTIYPFV